MQKISEEIEFYYNQFIEDDNSITLSLKDFDIVVNAKTKEEALILLENDLKEYINDCWEDMKYWYNDIVNNEKIKEVVNYTNVEIKFIQDEVR